MKAFDDSDINKLIEEIIQQSKGGDTKQPQPREDKQ